MDRGFKVAIFFNLFLVLFLVVISLLIGCKGSYIAGYPLEPDSTHNSTIFNVIYDQDSTQHWYLKLYDGELWCYFHNKYEDVRSAQ